MYLPFCSTWIHSLFFVGFILCKSLVFCVVFCRSLFVMLYFWPLYFSGIFSSWAKVYSSFWNIEGKPRIIVHPEEIVPLWNFRYSKGLSLTAQEFFQLLNFQVDVDPLGRHDIQPLQIFVNQIVKSVKFQFLFFASLSHTDWWIHRENILKEVALSQPIIPIKQSYVFCVVFCPDESCPTRISIFQDSYFQMHLQCLKWGPAFGRPEKKILGQ
jgi:hypothetical protein